MVLCSHANLAFCDLNCRHLHEHEIVKWNCKEVIYCDVRKKRVACEEVYENLKEIK